MVDQRPITARVEVFDHYSKQKLQENSHLINTILERSKLCLKEDLITPIAILILI